MEENQPGKVLGSEANQNGRSSVRWWRRSSVAAFLDSSSEWWSTVTQWHSCSLRGRKGRG
jgi:hypothetical protein